MAFGQSPFQIPTDIVNALKDNAYQNKYLPMQGLNELRDAVAKYTSVKKNYNYKPENVIIGPGSKELMFLLHILFDGEIILPAPRSDGFIFKIFHITDAEVIILSLHLSSQNTRV